jgi:hypothetical protein
MIFEIIALNIAGEEISSTGAVRQETIDAYMAYLAPVVVARYFIYVLALVFSALFSFGSGWLWRSASFRLEPYTMHFDAFYVIITFSTAAYF